MTIAQMAIDPLKGKYKGRRAQPINTVVTGTDPLIAKTLDMFVHLASKHSLPVLTANQIDLVNTYLPNFKSKDRNDILNESLANFLNNLIQKSYDAGNNDFTLTTNDFVYSYLASDLKGHEKNHLRLAVHGDVGFNFANKAKYLDAYVHGGSGVAFGSESEHCFFSVEGDQNIKVLSRAYKSKIVLHKVADNFESSKAYGCIFYGVNEQAYQTLRKNIPFWERVSWRNHVKRYGS